MPRTPPEEAELVARFRAGDQAAFRALFERHERLLRAWLVERIPPHVRRRFSAADVLQEACIVAFRRREHFEDRGENAFRAWLQGIVDRRLREEVRRHANVTKRAADRVATRSARPVTGLLVGAALSPGTVAASRELAAEVRAAMAGMRDDDRTVLMLALEEGLTLREVAEHMGRSREATKKLYGRALIKLRRAVLPDGSTDALR